MSPDPVEMVHCLQIGPRATRRPAGNNAKAQVTDEPVVGIEPTTCRLQGGCSAN